MTELEKVLEEYANAIVDEAITALTTPREIDGKTVTRVASGELARSLRAVVLEKDRVACFAVEPAAEYADFVHEGVNGTQNDRGSVYSYKKQNIDTTKLQEWIRYKPVPLRDFETGQFVPMTRSNIRSAAYLMGRKIAKQGIEGVPFFREAIDRTVPRFADRIADAIFKDNINGDNEL